MRSGICIVLLLFILLPAGTVAYGGGVGKHIMHSLDSLKQYGYEYADMSPMARKDRRQFARENRAFWLEEITYPFATPFTPEWAGKFKRKYTLDKVDLLDYFSDNETYDMVIIKGPNIIHDFSFEVIVYRKMDNGYLAVKSYLEKDRFVEKSYRMVSKREFSALTETLGKMLEMTEKQTGDFYFTDREALEECASGSEDSDSVIFACKVELTSGLVIDNTTGDHFLLYGYDGTYDPVHPRKVIYDRMREDELEGPFFRNVHWNKTYKEGESIAEVY
ncbi:hypothetical protein AB9P05_13130 [Roseivirga sp. BDSF3-8]|uniref:hypothetical protein n=1 Tax=Roseivirga sp. BDSF3-8 TaxID=3241598 RepID=UPI003531C6F9